MSKDTVLASMAVLAFLVALNDEWLYYLKGWISASVGGAGAAGLANTANNSTGPGSGATLSPQYAQPGSVTGTAQVAAPRNTSVGNQNLD